VWDGGPAGTGTDWSTDANWVGDVKPASGDDAVINTAGPTIAFNGVESVKSVTSGRGISFNGGTLTVATTGTATVAITLNGGTLSGGTWDVTGGSLSATANSGNTLSNVTVNGDLTLSASSARVTIAGTTTFQNA